MKSLLKKTVLTLSITTTLNSCQKMPATYSSFPDQKGESFIQDKEWQIISICTTPAIIDVNGDGEKDVEIISSLQQKERNKSLLFKKGGEVIERYEPFDIPDSFELEEANGTWKENPKKDSLTWIQEDGTVFKAGIKKINDSKLKLIYHANNTLVSFLLIDTESDNVSE